MDTAPTPVRFDTKIVVVLRDDLAGWQRLNVCAFMAGGVAAAHPESIGAPYRDADETGYSATFQQPEVVLAGDREILRAIRERALRRDLPLSIFTADLFATGNDDDNRAAVRAVPGADLDVVGIGLRGPRNAVDKIVKGTHMHP